MAFPDELVRDCFELCTEITLGSLNAPSSPKPLKMMLAREIVRMYHGERAAKDAENEFEKVFSAHEAPSEIPDVRVSSRNIDIVDLLVETGLASSKGEARRLVEQGGVSIDDRVLENWNEEVDIRDGVVVRVGKRKFVRLKTAS